MGFTRRARSTAVVMVALGVVAASWVPAAGLPRPPSAAQPATGPPTAVSISPSFTLTVRTSEGRSAASSCRGNRAVLGVGPSMILHGTLTSPEADCHDCCAENQVFSDGFESGGTTNWSGTVGG